MRNENSVLSSKVFLHSLLHKLAKAKINYRIEKNFDTENENIKIDPKQAVIFIIRINF